jgi:hypothetical protein
MRGGERRSDAETTACGCSSKSFPLARRSAIPARIRLNAPLQTRLLGSICRQGGSRNRRMNEASRYRADTPRVGPQWVTLGRAGSLAGRQVSFQLRKCSQQSRQGSNVPQAEISGLAVPLNLPTWP